MKSKEFFVDGSYRHTLTIPGCWEFLFLNELVEIVGGSQPPKSDFSNEPGEGLIRLIQIRDYKSKKHMVYIPIEKARRFCDKNDIMIGRYGPPIFQILRGLEGAYNVALMKAVPKFGFLDREYLFRYLENQDIYNYVESASDRTAGQSGVNKKHLEKYPIPLVPLAEQKQIAAKLDELLAQVDTLKTRLDTIPTILKRFRQSVLAAAVSGKLTEEWRENEGNLKWTEEKLDEITSNVVDCPHSTPEWSESGKYCVRTTAFNPFYLNLEKQGFVSEKVYKDRVSRLKPKFKDILYSREGTVGIACQIPKNVELCLGQRMVLIRAGDNVLSKYLVIVLNSSHILEIVKLLTVGSTVPRVNMKNIRAFPIPLPTRNEQTQIVIQVEKLFTFADKIEQSVKEAQKRVNNLTQSILAKAFRGELTADWREQNPDLISGENSAEALLEKIKAERESMKPAKRNARRKVET